MLLNVSDNFSEKREQITAEVGKPFTLEARQKLDGITLSNLPITAASIDIYNLLIPTGPEATCNLEMRPKGIIISFRAGNDTYSLVIPYYKFKVYKGRAEEYSFYKDNHFIKVFAGSNQAAVHSFVKKIRNFKADKASTRIEDV